MSRRRLRNQRDGSQICFRANQTRLKGVHTRARSLRDRSRSTRSFPSARPSRARRACAGRIMGKSMTPLRRFEPRHPELVSRPLAQGRLEANSGHPSRLARKASLRRTLPLAHLSAQDSRRRCSQGGWRQATPAIGHRWSQGRPASSSKLPPGAARSIIRASCATAPSMLTASPVNARPSVMPRIAQTTMRIVGISTSLAPIR